jgi:uncharacterized glyoxalase superfamily protein PhnB
MTTKFARAVPVLQVADVSGSMAWYSKVLGFSGWGFPSVPPHAFARLTRDESELMFQRATPDADVTAVTRPHGGMAVYLRVTGGRLLELATSIPRSTLLVRGPERMPYGDVEFAVTDPDGHVIVVSELLPDDVDVPRAREREAAP